MNHLPFKDWLSTDEPLSPDQSLALRSHLKECDDCQHMENALTDIHPFPDPAITSTLAFPCWKGRWPRRK
jgi:hypothetical protein